MLSLIFLSVTAFGNLTEPEPRLSCIDVNVRATCALSEVTFTSISDEPTFVNTCVGLTVLVGEGLWPYVRWSSPKILREFRRTRTWFILSREELLLEGDPTSYALSEIFCPVEAVDARFVPTVGDQNAERKFLKVGDMISEGARVYLVDGMHVNRSGHVYATLRDQETGQTIARTLN